jgi:ABC-type uncharacterized transport system involved in gliding motility auxiliary subunit
VNWREQIKNRKVIYGTGSFVSVLLVLGILIVAALLASRYQARWDLTKGGTQSLSTVTVNLLKQVDKPLTMTAFLPEGAGERVAVRDLLKLYEYANPKISFSMVDPVRDPLKAKEAGFRFNGNILLTYNGRHQMADRPTETNITNVLRRILQPVTKKIYFLTGHGERNLASSAKNGLLTAEKALKNEGYVVATLNLVTQPQVPQDAAVVVVAGPTKPLLSSEADALKTYLNRDGRLLVLLDPFQDGGLAGLLAGYGITLNNGLILDVNQVSQSLRLSPIMPLAIQYGPTRITRDFKNVFTIYPMSRPLLLNRGVQGVTLQPIVNSMVSSYEKLGQDWIKSGQANFDPKLDKKGPFTIGVLTEIALAKPAPAKGKPPAAQKPGESKEKKTYLAVYGSMDFADNSYFNLFGNGDLFLNTVNYLASEQQQIMVRTAQKAHLLMMTRNQLWILFLVGLVFAPLFMLGAGIWAYRVRRSRK